MVPFCMNRSRSVDYWGSQNWKDIRDRQERRSGGEQRKIDIIPEQVELKALEREKDEI